MSIVRHDFASREDLAKALAAAVGDDLVAARLRQGTVSLALSGGATPTKFFLRLGRRKDVAWEDVMVTLVDERWVPETHDRSNAMLVNEKLLQGPAAVARFVPLYAGGAAPDAAALGRSAAALASLPDPFAAVVLGMGTDGHTASFFPGADNLDAALEGTDPLVAITAPGVPEPRVTLSLDRLLRTEHLYVHIEGEAKAAVLAEALADGPVAELPIRAVLRQDRAPVAIYWCP